jgi:hypothetical protein
VTIFDAVTGQETLRLTGNGVLIFARNGQSLISNVSNDGPDGDLNYWPGRDSDGDQTNGTD